MIDPPVTDSNPVNVWNRIAQLPAGLQHADGRRGSHMESCPRQTTGMRLRMDTD